jgi:signal transduction histidine kinase
MRSVRGLRANILINIAVLMVVGMFLIGFVMLMTLQRDLLQAEISKANLVIELLEHQWGDRAVRSAQLGDRMPRERLEYLIRQHSFECGTVFDRRARVVHSSDAACAFSNPLAELARESMQSGMPSTRFTGSTWGVFWMQSRHLLMASPIMRNGLCVGSATLALPLEKVYEKLRRTQKLFFIYILINTIILTFVGVYRISKIYLEPIQRLVRRAEDYREDDGMLFAVRKEDNELHQLSKALNRMLERISTDRERLRSTVSSLEKANQELQQAQKDVIRAEKLASIGRLSAGIAHEIGNPIGIVMGYLELLRQPDVPQEEKNEIIQRTEAEIGRINRIIRQLLDLSRPSHDGAQSIHVHDIIEDLTDVVKTQPLMSGISIHHHLDAHEDLVFADPNQLRQVFLNLFINAADALAAGASERKGALVIKTETAPAETAESPGTTEALVITFSDDGPGIEAQHLSNIFDPFFTTKEPGKGTGLGLSVSFMIIEGMGGRIKAASERGRGMTMTITLPVHGQAEAVE